MVSSKLTTLATVTDKRMRQWSIAVRVDKVAGQRVACFEVWRAMKVKSKSRPIGSACCTVDEAGEAKLDDIRIDSEYRNTGIGLKLLTEIEKWAASKGIKHIYGDLMKIDSDRFPILNHMYTDCGWTWSLFGEGDSCLSRDSKIAGIVEKTISL